MKENLTMYKRTLIIAAAVFTAAAASAATRLTPTTIEEMARYGATHVITVTAADLVAQTNVSASIAFTNTVTQPCSIKFMGYVLDKQFQDAKAWDTNGVATTTNDLTLSCGDTNSTTRWINAVQAAYDSTPTITGSFGTDYTSVGSTAVVTKCDVIASNGVSFNLVSNVTVASTVTMSSPILNANTADAKLVVTATSGSTTQPSKLTRGQARFFFKIIGSGWQVK